MALFQREYELWREDLEAVLHGHDRMSIEEFSDALGPHAGAAGAAAEAAVRESLRYGGQQPGWKRLVAFKTAYGDSMGAVTRCLEKFFPQMAEGDIQRFIYGFFPFLFGVYPYTAVTDKQREALREARVSSVTLSIYEIARTLIETLLRGLSR